MKFFLKNFFIYGLSSIVTKMAGFFLIPLYTQLLTPTDYGNLFLLNSTYLMINLVSVGGFENSFARWFFDNDEQLDRNKTTASWLWSQFTINLGLVAIFSPFIPWFIDQFTTDLQYPILTVVLFVCATFFYIVPSVYINYGRVTQQAKKTVIFTVSFSLTTTLLSVWFVIFQKLNVTGIGLALFISNLIFTIIAAYLLRDKIGIKLFERKRAMEMFKFSFPFIPALISFWLLQSTDSYFIKLLTNSSEQIGFFSLGLTIASSMYVFTSAFQQIWPSYIFNAYRTMQEEQFKKLFAFFFEIYVIVYLFLQFNLTMFAYNIVSIFTSNPEFQPAYKVVGLISLNTIIYSFLSFTALGMNIKKVSAPLGIALTISAILGIVLNFIFIPLFGFVGSALATVLACLPVPVYIYLKSQKLYAFDIPSTRIILFTLMAFGFVGLFIVYPTFLEAIWNDILFKVGISLLLAGLIVAAYYRKIKSNLHVASLVAPVRTNETNASVKTHQLTAEQLEN